MADGAAVVGRADVRPESLRRRRAGLGAGRRRAGILLTLPALLALAATALYPLLWTVSLSLQRFSVAVGGPAPAFVGLENYTRVLQSSAFWTALTQTLG